MTGSSTVLALTSLFINTSVTGLVTGNTLSIFQEEAWLAGCDSVWGGTGGDAWAAGDTDGVLEEVVVGWTVGMTRGSEQVGAWFAGETGSGQVLAGSTGIGAVLAR